MTEIKTKNAALSLGILAALLHATWVIVVALGAGQAMADWKLGSHFLKIPYTVSAFDPLTGIALIITSFIGGAIVGAVFAVIWNWLNKK